MEMSYEKYLQFLAVEHTLVYVGDRSFELYDKISDSFFSSQKIDANAKNLDIIYELNPTLVIINIIDEGLANTFVDHLKKNNKNMLIFLLFDYENNQNILKTVSLADVVAHYLIEDGVFYKKLFGLLSLKYALKSIKRRALMFRHNNIKNENTLSEFFDIYEGSSLFLSDDLNQKIDELKAGKLSSDFLSEIVGLLKNIADIFSKKEELLPAVGVFEELISFLDDIDINTIEPKNLQGFTYLAEILYDIQIYMLDIFVDRIFKDVRLFKNSLKSNIIFMKNIFLGQNNEGKLEFLND